MDWTAVLNMIYHHGAAHKIIDHMFKDAKMLIGPGGVLQGRYLEDGTNKLRDSNAGDNNIDTAQTKTKLAPLKKQS